LNLQNYENIHNPDLFYQKKTFLYSPESFLKIRKLDLILWKKEEKFVHIAKR